MSDPTGTIREECGGKTYELRLTMRSLATLQSQHGNNVAGLLDGTAGSVPNFAALLDLVSLALQNGSKISAEDADEIADTMVTRDTDVVARVIQAAFPDAEVDSGNAKGPKAAA